MKNSRQWIYELKVILTDGDSFLFYDTLDQCIHKLSSLYGTVSKATLKVSQK